jgi:hypothetical protein
MNLPTENVVDSAQSAPFALQMVADDARPDRLPRRFAHWAARHAGDGRPRGVLRVPHGDRRSKLLERLAGAYRIDELRDYMVEFVESLRTRGKAADVLKPRLGAIPSHPSTRPVPKVHGLKRRDRKCLLSSTFLCVGHGDDRRVPPFQGGAPPYWSAWLFAETLLAAGDPRNRSHGYREVLRGAGPDNRTTRFAGNSSEEEPSDGLEPSTPSLPWKLRPSAI